MISYQAAPRAYFDAVIAKMRERGFEFMAWVTMNSRQNRYHVDCFRYSQESRLFFRAPRKACIVMLELAENFGKNNRADGTWDESYRQIYWSGFVDYAYNSHEWIGDEVNGLFAAGTSWGTPRDLTQLAADCLDDSVLEWIGNDFEQRDAGSSTGLLDPEELTAPFEKMLRALKLYLYPRFRELQVTGYAPYYTFPDQEPDFWERFPLPRLQNAAGRIWGSNFSRKIPSP